MNSLTSTSLCQYISDSRENIKELTKLLIEINNITPEIEQNRSPQRLNSTSEKISLSLNHPPLFFKPECHTLSQNPPNASLKRKNDEEIQNQSGIKKAKLHHFQANCQETLADNQEILWEDQLMALNRRIDRLVHEILEKAAIPTFNDESLVHLRSIIHLVRHKRKELENLIDHTQQNYDSAHCHFNLSSPICLSTEHWKVYWRAYDELMELVPVSQQDKKLIDSAIKILKFVLNSSEATQQFIHLTKQYANHAQEALPLSLNEFLFKLSETPKLQEKLGKFSLDNWIECFSIPQTLTAYHPNSPTYQASIRTLLNSSTKSPFLLYQTLHAFQNSVHPFALPIETFAEKLTRVPECLQKMETYSAQDWLDYVAAFETFISLLPQSKRDDETDIPLKKMLHNVCAFRMSDSLLKIIESSVEPLQLNQSIAEETLNSIYDHLLILVEILKMLQLFQPHLPRENLLQKILDIPGSLEKLKAYSLSNWKRYFNDFATLNTYISNVNVNTKTHFKITSMFHKLCTLYRIDWLTVLVNSLTPPSDTPHSIINAPLLPPYTPDFIETLKLLSSIPELEKKFQIYSLEDWKSYLSSCKELIALNPVVDQESICKLLGGSSGVVSALYDFKANKNTGRISSHHNLSNLEFVRLWAEFPCLQRLKSCSISERVDWLNNFKEAKNYLSSMNFNAEEANEMSQLCESVASLGTSLPSFIHFMQLIKSELPSCFKDYIRLAIKAPELESKLKTFTTLQLKDYIKSYFSMICELSLPSVPPFFFKQFDSLYSLQKINHLEVVLKKFKNQPDFLFSLLECSDFSKRVQTYSSDQWNLYFNFYTQYIANPHPQQDPALYSALNCLRESIHGVFLFKNIENHPSFTSTPDADKGNLALTDSQIGFLQHVSIDLFFAKCKLEQTQNVPQLMSCFAYREKYLKCFSSIERKQLFVPLCQMFARIYRHQFEKDDLWLDDSLISIRQLPEFNHGDENSSNHDILLAMLEIDEYLPCKINDLKRRLHFFYCYRKNILPKESYSVSKMLNYIYDNSDFKYSPFKAYEIIYPEDAKIRSFSKGISTILNRQFTHDEYCREIEILLKDFPEFGYEELNKISYLKIIISIFDNFGQNASFPRLADHEVLSIMSKMPNFNSKWHSHDIIEWVRDISEYHKTLN